MQTDFSVYISLTIEKQRLSPTAIVQFTQRLNNSTNDFFMSYPSKKILFAVDLLESMIKNCRKGFHYNANDSSFQKALLHLLRRQRGMSTMYQKLRSNKQNWTKIEAKVLYLIQLWYDAFMLEERAFNNIINNYKLLRKEGIIFPPRQENQKNMLAIKTQSPIFDNIEQISAQDQINFTKKKVGLGLIDPQIIKMSRNQPTKVSNLMNLQQVGELIAIIRSLDSDTDSTKGAYNKLKNIIQNKIVSQADKQLSKQILQQADKVLFQWDTKYGQNALAAQQQYMMKKKMASTIRSKIQSPQQQPPKEQNNNEPIDLLNL